MELESLIVSAARRLKLTPYWVGGPVRDALLGRPCHDWDLVTRHAHKLAQAMARQTRSRLITLDEQYRIYRLIRNDTTIDFAELQGATVEEDLARRDFTINAMASPITGHGVDRKKVIDPFHGQQDLRKRRLRAVSQKAFVDDPLRLLRAFRFSAQFGFSIDPQTVRWIAKHHRLLQKGRVARERVREELLRLLSHGGAGAVLTAMDETGLLTAIFPEIEAGRRVARAYYGTGGVVKHLLHSVQNVEWILKSLAGPSAAYAVAPNADVLARLRDYAAALMGGFPRAAFLKLAALLHDVGKPATAEIIRGRLRFFGHEEVGARMTRPILEALRFSRQENQRVQAWVRHHMRLGNLAAASELTDKASARFFRDLGEDGVGMLLVSLGDHYDYLGRRLWGKAKDPVEKTAQALLGAYYLRRDTVVPPKIINGHELMKALRLKPGPRVGDLLEAVQDAQTEGKIKTKADAIRVARSVQKVLSAKAAAESSPTPVPNPRA